MPLGGGGGTAPRGYRAGQPRAPLKVNPITAAPRPASTGCTRRQYLDALVGYASTHTWEPGPTVPAAGASLTPGTAAKRNVPAAVPVLVISTRAGTRAVEDTVTARAAIRADGAVNFTCHSRDVEACTPGNAQNPASAAPVVITDISKRVGPEVNRSARGAEAMHPTCTGTPGGVAERGRNGKHAAGNITPSAEVNAAHVTVTSA